MGADLGLGFEKLGEIGRDEVKIQREKQGRGNRLVCKLEICVYFSSLCNTWKKVCRDGERRRRGFKVRIVYVQSLLPSVQILFLK